MSNSGILQAIAQRQQAQQPMGYALDSTGQQQQDSLDARQKLLGAMMQPNQPSNTAWGGLANAGNSIASALAQRSLQGQQYGINQQNMQRGMNANVQGQMQQQANAYQPPVAPQNMQPIMPQVSLAPQGQ